MNQCTFIHAADLHLDAPFAGLHTIATDEHSKDILRHLTDATFKALDNLVCLCVFKKVDFLVLAGDIYNSQSSSLRARLALNEAFKKLQQAGIKVFLVHGNHDPLIKESNAITWPSNVHVFGAEPSTEYVIKNDQLMAVVQGVSHVQANETANLATLFAPRQPAHAKAMHVAILHCALSGSSEPHAGYAPCTTADLQMAQYDYWALGHVHTTQFAKLPQHGYYAYPGSLQGLHVNETGEHGCFLIQGQEAPVFIPLATLVWHNLQINISNLSAEANLNELEEHILQALQSIEMPDCTPKNNVGRSQNSFGVSENNISYDKIPPYTSPPSSVHAVRLVITGRSNLHKELSNLQNIEDLRQHLNLSLQNNTIWLRDIQAQTKPELDYEELLKKHDLLGEILRTSKQMQQDTDFLEKNATLAFGDLTKNIMLQAFLPSQQKAELLEILLKAETLCLDMLEGK